MKFTEEQKQITLDIMREAAQEEKFSEDKIEALEKSIIKVMEKYSVEQAIEKGARSQ